MQEDSNGWRGDDEVDDDNTCALLRGVSVTLGGNDVLRGLDMHVPRGCVYALLGPSGCGKTTLMRVLVGLYTPRAGSVNVLGIDPSVTKHRGSIGYVPQPLGLHVALTVTEHLMLYCRIAGMSRDVIEHQIRAFETFLRLPPGDKVIRHLSFGQQKLVSVCAGLLARPRLAILDEPTVGLDPLRREALWLLFESLTAAGTTVFVTTHHVNEAARADLVAMMRGGVLMLQDTPDHVTAALGVDNLENAYATAYSDRLHTQPSLHKTSSFPRRPPPASLPEGLSQPLPPSRPSAVATPKAVGQIFTFRMMRNVHLMIGLLTVGVQFLLAGWSLGGKPFDMPVAVINADRTPNGFGVVMQDVLVNNPDTNVAWEVVEWSPTAVEAATQRVRDRELLGVLHLTANLTATAPAVCGSRSTPFGFELGAYAVDANILSVLEHETYSSWIEALVQKDFDACSKHHDPTWRFHYVRGDVESTRNYIMSSLFMAMAGVVGIFGLGHQLMEEKANEALDRLTAMGVSPLLVASALVVTYLPYATAVFLIQLSVFLLLEDGPFQGNFALCWAIDMVPLVMTGTMSLAICMNFDTFADAFPPLYVVGWWTMYTAGTLWPIESFPEPLYHLALVNPLQWIERVFRGEALRGRIVPSDLAWCLVSSGSVIAVSGLVILLSLNSRTPLAVRVNIRLARWRARRAAAAAKQPDQEPLLLDPLDVE